MKTYPLGRSATIGIIQTAFLGDVALTLVLAQQIRLAAPQSRIIFVTTPLAAPLVACATAVDECMVYDKRSSDSGIRGIARMASELRSRNVECIISPHRSARSSLLARLAGARYRVGFGTASLSFLYNYRAPYKAGDLEIRRNLSLLAAFDIDMPRKLPQVMLSIPDAATANARALLAGHGIDANDKIIAMAAGSPWATKRWPPQYYAALAGMFAGAGFKVILIGSKADYEVGREISETSPSVNLAGRTGLAELLALLATSRQLVSGDSAPVHLATLVDCPAAVIYGATSAIFGFVPTGARDMFFELKGLKCHPCRIHGSAQCPTGTFDCMNKIAPGEVFERIMVRNFGAQSGSSTPKTSA